jgi:hypothetical protein
MAYQGREGEEREGRGHIHIEEKVLGVVCPRLNPIEGRPAPVAAQQVVRDQPQRRNDHVTIVVAIDRRHDQLRRPHTYIEHARDTQSNTHVG